MKILIICQYYYPEPFRITDISETLIEKGHEVVVLTGLPNYPKGIVEKAYKKRRNRIEAINGVRVIRTFEVGRGNNHFKLFLNYISFTISSSVRAIFLKEKFDVVFVNQLSPIMMAIPGIIYKTKNKTKMMLYCLDLWPESLTVAGIKRESLVFKIFTRISNFIYKSADKIAVTSYMFKDYFESMFDISPDDIEYIPQYAEDLFLGPELKEFNDITETYNFVFAGNIGEFQSVETIMYAANELKHFSNILFHIIGDGSKLEFCKGIAEKFSLSNVIFYGKKPIEEMPKYYSMADAMLVTLVDNKNISYTLPGKVQSYMASGKPIIGAINGEAQNVIRESMCGLCCEAENYIGLSKLILDFINSDNKDSMKKNSRGFYEKNFSKKIFFERLEKELMKLEDKNV